MSAKVKRARGRKARAILFAATLGAIVLPGLRQASATTDSWNVTTGGNWTDLNWTAPGGVPPSAGQDVYITNSFAGTQTITFDSGLGLTYHSLIIDATGGGTNIFSMPGNNLNSPIG